MFGDVTVKPRETHLDDDASSGHSVLHSVAWLVLILVIAGGAWYTFPILQQYKVGFTRLVGVQRVVDGMGDQMKETNAKIQTWASDQQTLRDQFDKLRATTHSQLDASVRRAEASSAQAYRRIESQIEERLQGVQTRLAHLESASDREQTRIAKLQEELGQAQRDAAQARSDVARQADELAAVRRQVEESGAARDRELAGVKQTQEASRRDVTAIEQKLAVQRVDFEVTKNHSHQLAEGISLGITGTDVSRRNVNGWMWVMQDRRTIWLKNQNAQQPVVFYGVQDGKKRELVITNVTSGSVTGYLLLPGSERTKADSTAAGPGE
jgi:chaperonin cofactor prefoldin